jgi:hypothetical protein
VLDIMATIHCFPSTTSSSSSNSNNNIAAHRGIPGSGPPPASSPQAPATAAATAAPTVALDTSALPAAAGGGAEFGLISPSSFFNPWVELGATANSSLNSFFEPPGRHPRTSPKPPSASPLPPSLKVLPSSFPADRKRPRSNTDSPASLCPPPPPARLPEKESQRRSGEAGAPKKENPARSGTEDRMSVHGQSNSSYDDKSRVASSTFFPEIPRILPHEKVGYRALSRVWIRN